MDTDTLYKCTVCGRVGTVGRCCGLETREPLNDAARNEQKKILSNLSNDCFDESQTPRQAL